MASIKITLGSVRSGITARATVAGDGSVTVAAGSTASITESASLAPSYATTRAELRKSGALVKGEKGLLRFAKAVEFASLSTAASVILGRQTNGRTAWKGPHGGKPTPVAKAAAKPASKPKRKKAARAA